MKGSFATLPSASEITIKGEPCARELVYQHTSILTAVFVQLACIFSVVRTHSHHARLRRHVLEMAPTISVGSCLISRSVCIRVSILTRSVNDLLNRFWATAPMLLYNYLRIRVVAVGWVALEWDFPMRLMGFMTFLVRVFKRTSVIVLDNLQPGQVCVQVRAHDDFVGFTHVSLGIVALPILIRSLL